MTQTFRDSLVEQFEAGPVIDVHSHLNRDHLAARGPEEVLLYHMLHYPLAAVGVPLDRDAPVMDRCRALLTHFDRIENTTFASVLRTILTDLYGFDHAPGRDDLDDLLERIGRRAAEPGWAEQVLDRARIVRAFSSQNRVGPATEGRYDGIRFTIESDPMPGNREPMDWGRYLGSASERFGKPIDRVDRMCEAVDTFYRTIDFADRRVLVDWIASRGDFRPVPERVVNAALRAALNGQPLTREQDALLHAAHVRSLCEAARGRASIVQLCWGIQILRPSDESAARRLATRGSAQFTSSLGFLFQAFPDLHFNLMPCLEQDEEVLCGHCLGGDNVSLAHFWWNGFFPSAMRRSWHRRLEMVPVGRLMGFFSDGWCAEWAYGRLRLVQRVIAGVLAEKVEAGDYTEAQAERIGRALFFDTPRAVFLPDEPAPA